MRLPLPVRILVSLCLLSYPQNFRRRYGQELRAFLEAEHRNRARGAGSPERGFWLRTLWSLLANGLAVRMEGLREPPPVAAGRSREGRNGKTRPGGESPALAGKRSVWGLAPLWRDLVLAYRSLGRSPGYTLTTILTLALGLGAGAVIFSLTYGVLLAPLPYPDEGHLVVLAEKGPGPDGGEDWVSPLTLRDWREASETFQGLASYRLALQTWTDGEAPRLLRGWSVSSEFFPVMGLDMTLGRTFTAEEDAPGGEPVVILSHGFWARAFGRDPEILNKRVTLDGRSHRVVGVAPEALDYPSQGEFWVPSALDYAQEFRDFRYLGVVGRIRPDRSIQAATLEMERISHGIAQENPATNQGWGVAMKSLREAQVGRVRPVLLGMALAVSILLLIALGNVTNLTIARSSRRQVDAAIRRALGAGSDALGRSFAVEGLILAGAGSFGGLLLAWLAQGWLLSSSLIQFPRLQGLRLDLRTFGSVAVAAVLVGLLLGLVAWLGSGWGKLAGILRSGSAGGMAPGKSHNIRAGVLVGQVALALTLLIGASLLTRSLLNLSRVDPGFEPRGLLTFSYSLPGEAYPDADAVRAFQGGVLGRLRSNSAMEAAGVVAPLPMEMGSVPSSWSLSPDVRPPEAGAVMAHMRTASPGYFPAMGVRLLSGRLLQETDGPLAESVVLVNRTFAETYLPGLDPLGQRITAGEPDAQASDWSTIVGVVEDIRFRSLRSEGEPEIYLPADQFPTPWGHLVVRSSLSREALVRGVSEAVRAVDPGLALSDIKDGSEIIGSQLRTARLSVLLTCLFACAATFLAVVGIMGILSILVAQRMREMGLRKALGAEDGSIRWHVVRKGLRPVVVGLVLGTVVSMLGTRILESQVFGVGTLDLVAFVLPVVGLLLAGFLVCLVPGSRAAAADPVELLQDRT